MLTVCSSLNKDIIIIIIIIINAVGNGPGDVFKTGDKSEPSNYRPISLTRVLCKVLEYIVASSLSRHFTDLNILYELQHGFRERRSCDTQLIMLVDKLSKNMQTRKQTDLILLDFSKAFDKFAHEKLQKIALLRHLGGYTKMD